MSRRILLSFVVLLVLGAIGVQADDEVAEQATWLIKKATLVHPDGSHNLLLRSLRQMRDPQLEPLFSALVQRKFPTMKVHGMLGLAEISPQRRLDLALLANLDNPALQAQLVSAALDAKLLNDDDCQKIIAWPGIEPAVKVICAAKLLGADRKFDPALLDKALASDNLGLKSMAALLRLQMGQAKMAERLDQLDASQAANRDPVRLMLLQTALRYDFDKAGPWALKLIDEPGLDRSLSYRAMRVALKFVPAAAAERLVTHFQATDNPAEKIRLAIMAIDVADKLDTNVFKKLYASDQEIVRQIARTGGMIAEHKPVRDDLFKLIRQYNALASRWVLEYANRLEPAQARPFYVELIRSAEDAPKHFRPLAMELVVMATQKLYESGEATALAVRDLLSSVDMVSQEAMLMGLIRSRQGDSAKVIAGMTDWKSDFAASLALLLRAKHGQPLDDEMKAQLAIMVRGGIRDLQEPLRIQAAWIYLKLTHQDRVALASVIGGTVQ